MGEEEHPPIQELDLGLKVQERLTKLALEHAYIIDHLPGEDSTINEVAFVMNNGTKTYELSMTDFVINIKVLNNDKEDAQYSISSDGYDKITPRPLSLYNEPILDEIWKFSRPLSTEETNTLLKDLLVAEPDPIATEEDFKKTSAGSEFGGPTLSWAKEQPQLPFKLPFPEPNVTH